MAKDVPWGKGLGARLGGMALLLLAVSLALVLANLYTLSSMQADAASLEIYTRGRMYAYQLLYLTEALAGQEGDDFRQTQTEMERLIKDQDERYAVLENGGRGVPPVTDPDILRGVRD